MDNILWMVEALAVCFGGLGSGDGPSELVVAQLFRRNSKKVIKKIVLEIVLNVREDFMILPPLQFDEEIMRFH